jgi:hypothetical protein
MDVIDITEAAAEVAAKVDFGKASANKRGRNPKFPYVPVVIHSYTDRPGTYQSQILGRAYVTRQEAVAMAEAQIAHLRAKLATDLVNPCQRALREWYGLPREIGAQS